MENKKQPPKILEENPEFETYLARLKTDLDTMFEDFRRQYGSNIPEAINTRIVELRATVNTMARNEVEFYQRTLKESEKYPPELIKTNNDSAKRLLETILEGCKLIMQALLDLIIRKK